MLVISDTVLLSPQSSLFVPAVIDGVVLPKAPEEILAKKNFNTVPYIVGFNKQEFGWLMPTGIHEDAIPAAVEKYVRGSNDPVKIRDGILELLGDVTICVTSVITSRGHRGESQKLYGRETKILLLWSLTWTLPRID
ncbi:hypothetical protein A6R68_04219, partial [Neotoma lepida]